MDQFARNYLKPTPYATHEDLPTTRVAMLDVSSMANRGPQAKDIKAKLNALSDRSTKTAKDGPFLEGRHTLLWGKGTEAHPENGSVASGRGGKAKGLGKLNLKGLKQTGMRG